MKERSKTLAFESELQDFENKQEETKNQMKDLDNISTSKNENVEKVVETYRRRIIN